MNLPSGDVSIHISTVVGRYKHAKRVHLSASRVEDRRGTWTATSRLTRCDHFYRWAGQRPDRQNVDLVRRRDLGEPRPDSQWGKARIIGRCRDLSEAAGGRRARRPEGADGGAVQTLCRSIVLHREWKRTERVASKPAQVGMGCKRATCQETSPINQRPLIWYRE
jgi:hypothetical protein